MPRSKPNGRADWWILGCGILVSWASVRAGAPIGVSALLVAGLPIVNFLVTGAMPGRGAFVGSTTLAFGSVLIAEFHARNVASGSPTSDLFVLSSMAIGAVFAGTMIERNTATEASAAPAGSRWVSIEIATETPPDVGGELVRPKRSPRSDPDRRSLTRLFQPKLKRWKRSIALDGPAR